MDDLARPPKHFYRMYQGLAQQRLNGSHYSPGYETICLKAGRASTAATYFNVFKAWRSRKAATIYTIMDIELSVAAPQRQPPCMRKQNMLCYNMSKLRWYLWHKQ